MLFNSCDCNCEDDLEDKGKVEENERENKKVKDGELNQVDMGGKEAEDTNKNMTQKGFLRPRRETLHPDLPLSISIHHKIFTPCKTPKSWAILRRGRQCQSEKTLVLGARWIVNTNLDSQLRQVTCFGGSNCS